MQFKWEGCHLKIQCDITSKRQEKSLIFSIINKVISETHSFSEEMKLHAIVLVFHIIFQICKMFLVLNRLWILEKWDTICNLDLLSDLYCEENRGFLPMLWSPGQQDCWEGKKRSAVLLGDKQHHKEQLLKKSIWLSLEKIAFLHYLLFMGTCSVHSEHTDQIDKRVWYGQMPWPHCKCPKARAALRACLGQNGAFLIRLLHTNWHFSVFFSCVNLSV